MEETVILSHPTLRFALCRHPPFSPLLKGLHYIHKIGYVHCDIKLQNILLCLDRGVKIADFGLAKRAGGKEEGVSRYELRGTPLYMSPEMVVGGEQGPPADIWALGCAVAEMVTGTPAWRCSDLAALLGEEEVPEVPGNLSGEGKDFLEKCFVKDPSKRWTADMLLNHPFVADQDFGDTENITSTSPRCPFDFPDWASSVTSTTPPPPQLLQKTPEITEKFNGPSFRKPQDRVLGILRVCGKSWILSFDSNGELARIHTPPEKNLIF
ncbi:mitogen-activated protein kinase kinase kinase 19 [Abeliophyllum distichum]|uniref:Mitogen-activated protein kinase kinase kinase 19 n=1 Tax=Abeliophyllum distichum TaxID=126358 RepID=A0ABD1UJW4_9LAMI